MKFIKLESRGGNYLVVASNVAWLRTAEKGQTNVGIIGSQPLLVVGSVEEVAEKILNGMKGIDAEEEAHAPPPAAPQPIPAPQEPALPVAEPEPVAEIVPEAMAEKPVYAPQPEPEPLPEPVMAAPEPELVPPADHAEPEPEPAFTPVRLQPRPAAPIRPRPAASSNAPLWERPAAPAAKGLKIKVGSQRMMGMLE